MVFFSIYSSSELSSSSTSSIPCSETLCGMDTEIPKWLNVFVSISWYVAFSIFFLECYFQLYCRLLFNTRKLLAGSGIDLDVSKWGHYIAFVKGHMVCLLRIVIYVGPVDSQFVWHFLHHMFDVLVFHLFTNRIVNEAAFSVIFPHKRDACDMHHRGGGSDILQLFWWYSFHSSVNELCRLCFQISHIVCNYTDGSIQVWSKVFWATVYVVLVTFLSLVTW